MKLTQGDTAPDFSLPDQNGNQVSLHNFRGKKVILYFYPKANTSGWTTQAVSLRDAGEHLNKLNVAVIGISPDNSTILKKFDDRNGLGFVLLSDPDHTVAEKYGVWGEKTMYWKKVQGITRSSFLIDEEGRIAGVWYKVKPDETAPKALKVLRGE